MNDVAEAPGAGVTILFCAAAGNIGRTTAVINVALILAATGRRVLVVDAGRGRPRVGDYLPGFRPAGDITGDAAAPDRPVAGFPALEYDASDISGYIRLLRFDGDRPLGEAELAEIRAARGAFDHVLVDMPGTGRDRLPDDLADLAGVAGLADLIVTCFPMNPMAIEAAAGLAARLQRDAGRPVGLVALGLRADPGALQPLEEARQVVRDRFDGLVAGEVRYAEIPYSAAYAATGAIAMLSEPPGHTGGLRPAYEELADRLAAGGAGVVRRVTLVRTARHRAWTEWAAAQLERFGVRVTTVAMERFGGERHDAGHAVVVVSPAGLEADQAARLRRMAHPAMRLVLVDDLPLPEGFYPHDMVDLRGAGEAQAVRLLRRALGLGGPYADAPVDARFPGAPPASRLPARNPGFVGRDGAIDALRDTLLAARGEPGTACVLHGPAGTGKTEIALEYAHRFAGAYDVVWWVPARDERAIRESLDALAARLAVPAGADAALAAVDHLAAGRCGAWLLVYDRAPAGGPPAGLVPAGGGHGHVVITSAAPAVDSRHPGIEVVPFQAAESVALLAARVPGIRYEQAEAVAGRVGHLPLVLDLAASWLATLVMRLRQDNLMVGDAVARAVDRFCDDHARKHEELQDQGVATTAPRVMLELTLDTLPSDIGGRALRLEGIGGQAALRLLRACSLLSPDGVDLRLLRSWAMIRLLGGEEKLRDPLMVDVMLRTLGRYGLVRADLGVRDRPVQVHPLIAGLVRDRKGPDATLVADLRLALASWAELDPDDPFVHRVFDELDRHFDGLAPWEDDRATVRWWVLRQLGHLLRRDDRPARERVREIGLKALAAWEPEAPLRLRLLNVLSQVSRLQGDHRATERFAAEALRLQRAALGVNHPRTLLTAGAHAAALRTLGEFDEALHEERDVLRELRELLGAHHPATGDAMHNLSISEALNGDPARALRLASERRRLRVQLAGAGDAAAAHTAIAMARYHRDLGQLEASHRLLKAVLSRGHSLGTRRGGPPLDVLGAESGLAITERRLGHPYMALERDERVLAELRAHQGDHHLLTLTCLASLAADLDALGKHRDAADHAAACLDGLAQTFPDRHPYTQVCVVALGAYLRNDGRLDEGRRYGEQALDVLGDRLGAAHPWTIAAAVALAGTLVAQGDVDTAIELERAAVDGFADAGLPDHPNARLVEANLAGTLRRAAGEPPSASAARRDIDLEIPEL
ncbi:NTPase [Sphaerisporangium rufum]|uniref:NTPase n=1 Tax=Sphaerisporangium rufum TaxID=1381558 RepID=A0A919RC06_9ACTN|nr:FxSxx-COOH system tetratricopeptide repeat protein [Sphaerisporangium rufum]GII81185.1 NTPase [Sphaerisporangium rufum]